MSVGFKRVTVERFVDNERKPLDDTFMRLVLGVGDDLECLQRFEGVAERDELLTDGVPTKLRIVIEFKDEIETQAATAAKLLALLAEDPIFEQLSIVSVDVEEE